MDNFIQIIKEKMNHFSFHSNYTPSSKKWSYIIPLLVVLILSIVGEYVLLLPIHFQSQTFIFHLIFLLVLFAALTSAISLMECSVATLMEQLHISRKKASFVMIGEMLLLGIPISLGYGVLGWIQPLGMTLLDFFDFVTNSCMMPVAALSTVLLIIFVTKISTVSDEVKISSVFKREKIYNFVMKYICVPTLIVILLSYILSTFGIITL